MDILELKLWDFDVLNVLENSNRISVTCKQKLIILNLFNKSKPKPTKWRKTSS
jgi:hypothetical protein